MRHTTTTLLAGTAMLLLAGTPAAAARCVVETAADEADTVPGDTKCLTKSGASSLRAAVQELNAIGGGQIFLPKGTYLLTIAGEGEDAAATGDLDIAAGKTITGEGSSATLIDASVLEDRIFDVQPGGGAGGTLLTLSDVGATGGSTTGTGGGVRTAGRAYLVNTALFKNQATNGGGVAGRLVDGARRALLVCILSEIVGNSATGRGGKVDGTDLERLEIGTANVQDDGCRVANNKASKGGGIVSSGNAALGWLATGIRKSTVADNVAAVGAGLLGGVSIARTTFSGNRASVRGGAIALAAGSIENSTFSGNRAPRGGAVSGGAASLSVRHATFALNGGLSRTEPSAGAHLSWREPGAARLGLASSLIAFGGGLNSGVGSFCDAAAGRIVSSGYNLAVDATCQLTGVRDGMGVRDLRISNDLESNGGPTRTHRLDRGSPAVDRGNSERGRPATDQRGYRRPAQYMGAPDTGAFEFGAPP
jgi:predicted outer membrane repeat protein